MKSYWLLIATVIVSLIVGAWLGAKLFPEYKTDVVTKIEYVHRPPVRFDGVNPAPIKVAPITIPDLARTDTVFVSSPVDTAALVADYCLKRDYALDFSTDTTGVFKVNVGIAYNRLCDYSAEVQPLERQTETVQTVIRQRLLRPFVCGSAALVGGTAFSAGAGVVVKEHHAPSVKYLRMDKDNMIVIGYAYIF